MNTSKSLLAILVEELPKLGGWPDCCHAITQDSDAAINTYNSADGLELNQYGTWRSLDSWMDYCITAKNAPCLASDYATAIITRDQYEAALADTATTDGWIDWAGGECPVERGTLVDVRYRDSTAYPDKYGTPALVAGGYGATDRHWLREGMRNDIIAYRLHQPQDANSRANDDRLEADLNECIGQPQSNEHARDEILYELANFAASTVTSLDIGVATNIAIWLSDKGYRKQ
ncbi:hypothetical protein BI096_gp27 [Enterobacter phage Arya]|uniref:Uncharacterized protein n=1 Tax=Enterobacter phage Arya TaxID=1864622 RepID=A0A193GZ03_9CAUD|nr:hypothetical protein BI096_gp27 [Enterobacter phage Arya]ANN86135.1 hypothetical protein BI096_gp27 [Enterobacter phage Arya]